MEELRVYWRHLSDPEGPGRGGEVGREALESGNEGCVPGTAALASTKAFPGGESEGKADAVRMWLLREAGAEAGLDAGFFLGELAVELSGRGAEGAWAGARLSAHLPPVKEGGRQSVRPAAYLRKVTFESCRPSSPS